MRWPRNMPRVRKSMHRNMERTSRAPLWRESISWRSRGPTRAVRTVHTGRPKPPRESHQSRYDIATTDLPRIERKRAMTGRVSKARFLELLRELDFAGRFYALYDRHASDAPFKGGFDV